MKKNILTVVILMFILMTGTSFAQVTQLTIGVDGFTCSLCAKGVEEQFKSLDFVKSVKTDLKNTRFILSFNASPKINVTEISDAVYDGGFSVRDIKVEAKGTIAGNSGSGFTLITPNSKDLNLKNVNGDLSNGDKVIVKGKVNAASNSISVTSIKKL
ncbi:MAG: cation transporter [bacterium]|nr:cation transporter [bacterium]